MAPKQPSSLKLEIQPDTFAAGFEETHQTLHTNLQDSHANQTQSEVGKEVVFGGRDKV